MNYIKQLEADKKELQEEINKTQEVLMELYVYLNSDKFKGFDSRDESLKDYVNVRDVIDRILPIMHPHYKISFDDQFKEQSLAKIDNRPISVKSGITECVNCNTEGCKNGSGYKPSKNSDHCENRVFEGDGELYTYIDSQY